MKLTLSLEGIKTVAGPVTVKEAMTVTEETLEKVGQEIIERFALYVANSDRKID